MNEDQEKHIVIGFEAKVGAYWNAVIKDFFSSHGHPNEEIAEGLKNELIEFLKQSPSCDRKDLLRTLLEKIPQVDNRRLVRYFKVLLNGITKASEVIDDESVENSALVETTEQIVEQVGVEVAK